MAGGLLQPEPGLHRAGLGRRSVAAIVQLRSPPDSLQPHGLQLSGLLSFTHLPRSSLKRMYNAIRPSHLLCPSLCALKPSHRRLLGALQTTTSTVTQMKAEPTVRLGGNITASRQDSGLALGAVLGMWTEPVVRRRMLLGLAQVSAHDV